MAKAITGQLFTPVASAVTPTISASIRPMHETPSRYMRVVCTRLAVTRLPTCTGMKMWAEIHSRTRGPCQRKKNMKPPARTTATAREYTARTLS